MKVRNLIVAAFLALSVFGGAQKAQAVEPAGHSFCKGGMKDPDELARRMDVALVADSAGNHKLEKCMATPSLFLKAFQQADPGAGLTSVSQLPGYVRSLEVLPTKKGMEYETSCLLEAEGGAMSVDMVCVTRPLRGNEVVYGNPVTRVGVLMQSCVNPGAVEVPPIVVDAPACLEVRFPSNAGDSIRFAYIGPRLLSGRCHKYAFVGRAVTHDTPEECPDSYEKMINGRKVKVVCSWDEVEQAVSGLLGAPSQVQNVSGSFVANGDGTNSWYLPPDALDGEAVICWELPDGTFRTLGVRRGDYIENVATITRQWVYPSP